MLLFFLCFRASGVLLCLMHVLTLLFCYTNQKYEQYCREHPRGSAAHCFRGYRPSSKEEVLAFMGLSFISGAYKATKNPISDLYDSKFLPHFKAALSSNKYLLPMRFRRFDDVNTRDDRKDDRFGHIREAWDTFNNRCRELYGLRPHTTIDCKKCCKKSVVAVDLGSTCPVSQGGIALSI